MTCPIGDFNSLCLGAVPGNDKYLLEVMELLSK